MERDIGSYQKEIKTHYFSVSKLGGFSLPSVLSSLQIKSLGQNLENVGKQILAQCYNE